MAARDVSVFGAGAMGTAVAIHMGRAGHRVRLWASQFDRPVMQTLLRERRHPAIPEQVPETIRVLRPEELDRAVTELDIAVMAAHSGGARTLARVVMRASGGLPTVVGLAKGLEPDTGKRMSEVYSEEVGHDLVVSMGGPCLAAEVAQGLPTQAVFAAAPVATAEEAAGAFGSGAFRVLITDDVAGVEYCTVAKNVAAIGLGIVDGLGKLSGAPYRNIKAALFAQAIEEMALLVAALGGRRETVLGPAGLGDALVTSLAGRNRLFGELVGEGLPPDRALEQLAAGGMTVEGWASAGDVRLLSTRAALELPFLCQVNRILFDGAAPGSLLEW